MEKNEKLKVFISYSHKNEDKVDAFRKHMAPLKNSGFTDDWYDRKIIAGQLFQEHINNNLKDADIICLFVSADFLASKACLKEKDDALELMQKKGVNVVPIILSPCGWMDDAGISILQALPTDGQPISEFSDSDKGWNIVYEGLKKVFENEIKIKRLSISQSFSDFLQNTDLLMKAHSQKEKVLLDDIFVFPEMFKYDSLREFDKKFNSAKIIDELYEHSNILIAGENQSGKTSLCKKIFEELRTKNCIPIYLSASTKQLMGNITKRLADAFEEQYEKVQIEDLPQNRIIPIIDDFHYTKDKEKYIQALSIYSKQIIVVDDIFNLNFRDEKIMRKFIHFKITEFSPLLRYHLIKKWTSLTDRNENQNYNYKSIDDTTEIVNTALGKIIGGGIMPSYPFFILSIISSYESFKKPLDQEITSQGYCYQVLIYLLLSKQSVKSDEIGTYINFLSELAFYIFKEKKYELSNNDFLIFMKEYLDKFNLPFKQEILLRNLHGSQIVSIDSCGNYRFCFSYLYYFFVGKYLAEHRINNKEIVDKIINNLHKNENAYIAIFISHHSNSADILDELTLNAMCLFDKYKPAELTKKELRFFDQQITIIIKEALPPAKVTPEQVREKRLERQEILEKSREEKERSDNDEDYDEFVKEFRRSVKTVEVMGRILKNHAGSIEKSMLEKVFEEAMKVQLRILSSFFKLIEEEKIQKEIIDFISNRLEKIIAKMESKPEREKLEKISETIFWNLNFFVVFGILDKIIHSLGSDKVLSIVEKVCNEVNSPATFLIKHGIIMWYNKNLQIDNIMKGINENKFSEIAKKIMRFLIVNHASMHIIGFKEKQKIEQKFGIPTQKLLIRNIKDLKNK